MIRLMSRVSSSPEAVRELFTDVDSWPNWMPGLQGLEVLERQENRLVVRAVQRQKGRDWTQIQEISITPDGLLQRQIQGNFRRWDAQWRFVRPPDGLGTTVSLNLVFDLGLMGMVIPRRTLQNFLDELFEQIVHRIDRRSPRPEHAEPSAPGVFLRVVRTLRGLEVEIAGERYLLRSVK